MHSWFACTLLLLCFSCIVKSDNACVCTCRAGQGQLHTFENVTVAACSTCTLEYCQEHTPDCNGANTVINATCGTLSAWTGNWAVDNTTRPCHPETCCCMHDVFSVSATDVEGKYTFTVNVVGQCDGKTNATGTIVAQTNSSSVGYTTFHNEPLVAVNVNSKITFFPLAAVATCVPGNLECDSGDCKPFPTGVIIAVVVIIVIVLGVGVAVFLWYRKRTNYQSL